MPMLEYQLAHAIKNIWKIANEQVSAQLLPHLLPVDHKKDHTSNPSAVTFMSEPETNATSTSHSW